MKILVTGSSGHLGEALARTLQPMGHEVVGLDVLPGPFTTVVGSISDRAVADRVMADVAAVFHLATLHKPHVGTHSRHAFIDTNLTGTLNLLEAAVARSVGAFIFTSTTSVFGAALVPPPAAPAAWITEEVRPIPKNIYGVTKAAAEDLCHLFQRNYALPVVVLRTSRFFPEEDDDAGARDSFSDANLKANEYLFRRVDIEDVVSAHLLALEQAGSAGFARYIVSAPTPFHAEDVEDLRQNPAAVVERRVPDYAREYQRRGWRLPESIDRVYVSERAIRELGWRPRYDFRRIIALLQQDEETCSPLARLVGSKGYHAQRFAEGPYPVA